MAKKRTKNQFFQLARTHAALHTHTHTRALALAVSRTWQDVVTGAPHLVVMDSAQRPLVSTHVLCSLLQLSRKCPSSQVLGQVSGLHTHTHRHTHTPWHSSAVAPFFSKGEEGVATNLASVVNPVYLLCSDATQHRNQSPRSSFLFLFRAETHYTDRRP